MCCFLVSYFFIDIHFEDFDYFFIWKEGIEKLINLIFSYIFRAEVLRNSQAFLKIWSNNYFMACARHTHFAASLPFPCPAPSCLPWRLSCSDCRRKSGMESSGRRLGGGWGVGWGHLLIYSFKILLIIYFYLTPCI